MTALAKDRNTPSRAGDAFSRDVAAAKKIFAGSLVALDSSGNAQPGATATGLVAAGRAAEYIDNSSGNAGDKQVTIEPGVFRWANSSAGDAITKAEIGDLCYIVDDQTVAKTNGTNTRSVAGYIVDVDSDGVWVVTGSWMFQTPTGALLAANNGSDIANAATFRGNLGGGANKCILQIRDIDLIGANAEVKRVVTPVAGTIAKIYSTIDGALTTGDATLTGKIGATAITDGAITVTQSGSAAGDVDVVTPSALNVVSAGDVISITVGGTNDAAKFGDVTILITPSA